MLLGRTDDVAVSVTQVDVFSTAAYLELADNADGAAVEDVVVERPRRGDVVLDFDADGRLLELEVIGAAGLLRATALSAAERL